MLRINESSVFSNNKRIERNASNCFNGGLKFDKAGLKNKLEEYRRLITIPIECECKSAECKHKKKRENYIAIMGYIENLIAVLNKYNKLKLKWVVKNNKVVADRFPLYSSVWCNFNIIDYIYKNEEKIVVVSYKQLWDALAFQIAHRDIGYASREIDEILEDNGYGICDINCYGGSLAEIIDNKAYNQATSIKEIKNCQYCSKDKKEIYDYFGDRLYCTTYKELIDTSINKAMIIIIDDTLKKLTTNRDSSVQFLGVMDEKIYFNTGLDNETIYDTMCSPFTIKLFGREFEITPCTNIIV